MQFNADLSKATEDATLSVSNTIKTVGLLQAAEFEDIRLVVGAISACAQREKARAEIKFGRDSLEARRIDTRVALLQSEETVLSAAAERVAADTLQLLR